MFEVLVEPLVIQHIYIQTDQGE
uniref:Uncharacterized protein n=1 Tax=Anguilla anguilla TaxID=7936 RepID=A0A0E9RX97_ANGAN